MFVETLVDFERADVRRSVCDPFDVAVQRRRARRHLRMKGLTEVVCVYKVAACVARRELGLAAAGACA